MAVAACAQDSLRERWSERLRSRMETKLVEPPAAGVVEKKYGDDPLQTFDYWAAKHSGAPLVVFVHGGGWSRGDKRNATGTSKVENWLAQGYAVASVNYRLVPQVTVEQEAQDVANALASMKSQAAELGFDADKIVLTGHSAGAQLVALVGTDGRYLAKAGLSANDLVGLVAIDGAAYDIPAQMNDGPPIMKKTYVNAFGSDPKRQRALSPALQDLAANTPAFLIIHVKREDGIRQARELADALEKAGVPVTRRQFSGSGLKGHMEINRSLGDPDYPATAWSINGSSKAFPRNRGGALRIFLRRNSTSIASSADLCPAEIRTFYSRPSEHCRR
ncbi:MAG: alpha/beta hydrolase [Sphingobium sp.]